MSQIEGTQVVLRLSSDPAILAELRKKKSLTVINGREVFVRQFDSRPFEFTPGSQVTVGETVAKALVRDSSFIVGDALTGQVVHALEILKSFDAGKGVTANVCPYCSKPFDRPQQLGRHLLRDCENLPESAKSEDAAEEAADESPVPSGVPASD